MSLYNQDHPYSNGLEALLDGHSRDWPILFALVVERLQRIELELEAAKQGIAELRAASSGSAQCRDSSSSPARRDPSATPRSR
jgi:hypothetical protein